MNEIKLIQKPVIEHQLLEVGKKVTERIEALNLDKLVASPETVKSLKDLRAKLNKELEGFEVQRKAIAEAVNAPVKEFKTVYEAEISEKYKKAVNSLKDKIAEVETVVKEKKREEITAYFKELCESENIDFVEFSKLGLDVNLSTTLKQYKEKCNEFIARVSDDLELIKLEEFEAEIMVQYKDTLNASAAITSVKKRKEEERQEKERIKLEELSRRTKKLLGITVVYHETTKVYLYNDSIYVSESKVTEATKEEFEDIFLSLQLKIKTFVRDQEAAKKAKEVIKPKQNEEPVMHFPSPAAPAPPPQTKEPLKAPEQQLEIVEANFNVKGTNPQLLALGQYMRDNGITYKNI